MRWSVKQERERKEWNLWFAWWPTRIDREWVWLEWVERKFVERIPAGEGPDIVIYHHRNPRPMTGTEGVVR